MLFALCPTSYALKTMIDHKKVSIIIPTYNEEKYLPSCLRSILDMNYSKESIEIIVVDNGSTDETVNIANDFGVEILEDHSLNVSGLRNLGARKATGEVLAFVDADCIVDKDWLHNAARYIGDMHVSGWGSPPVFPENQTWVQKTWFLIRQKENIVQDVDWLETMNLFVRKEQFAAIGGFNESLVTCEDVDFSYRISNHGKIVSDSRIKVVHLGEASTIKEFMKKEIWRGQSNLKGILSHGLVLKEIPSLSIPIYFGILFPMAFFATIVFLDPGYIFLSLFFYMLPTLGVFIKVRSKKIKFGDMLRLLFLIQVYFFSRTVALVKWK